MVYKGLKKSVDVVEQKIVPVIQSGNTAAGWDKNAVMKKGTVQECCLIFIGNNKSRQFLKIRCKKSENVI